MAKIYSRKTFINQQMLPKKETIHFILNYSKALTVIKARNIKCEIISN